MSENCPMTMWSKSSQVMTLGGKWHLIWWSLLRSSSVNSQCQCNIYIKILLWPEEIKKTVMLLCCENYSTKFIAYNLQLCLPAFNKRWQNQQYLWFCKHHCLSWQFFTVCKVQSKAQSKVLVVDAYLVLIELK